MITDNSLNGLHMRRSLCKAFIKFIEEECSGDERQEEALKEYNDQLRQIEAKIQELTGKPAAIVVGLRTAKLFGEEGKE